MKKIVHRGVDHRIRARSANLYPVLKKTTTSTHHSRLGAASWEGTEESFGMICDVSASSLPHLALSVKCKTVDFAKEVSDRRA